MTYTHSKLIFMAVVSVLSNGCAHSVSADCAPIRTNYTPVSTNNYPDTAKYEPEYYLVKKDDTLYAISRLFDLDYRQLARWNRIDPPSYSIEIGQKIRLSDPVWENKLKQEESLLPRIRVAEQLPGASKSNVLDSAGASAKTRQRIVGNGNR